MNEKREQIEKFRVLSDAEAAELIVKGRLLDKVTPPDTGLLTEAQADALGKGQPLFAKWKGGYYMVAMEVYHLVAYEVKVIEDIDLTEREVRYMGRLLKAYNDKNMKNGLAYVWACIRYAYYDIMVFMIRKIHDYDRSINTSIDV